MYFLKIAVLSPILSTKRLSFNDSTITNYQIVMFSRFVFVLTKYHYWALAKRKIVFHALLLFYVSKIFCREFSRQWWTLYKWAIAIRQFSVILRFTIYWWIEANIPTGAYRPIYTSRFFIYMYMYRYMYSVIQAKFSVKLIKVLKGKCS